MLDFRRTFWALWLGTAVVGMLVPTPVLLAQIAVSASDNKVVLVNGVATIETGKGPAGLSINRQGTLALVANRSEGTVSVLSISGKDVKNVASVPLGDTKTGVSHVAISPDGKTALVTRDGDSMVSVLAIDGAKVEYTKRDLTVGTHPYGVAISADGMVAVVANIPKHGGKRHHDLQTRGGKLEDTGQRLKMKGGPAAIRTAEKPL